MSTHESALLNEPGRGREKRRVVSSNKPTTDWLRGRRRDAAVVHLVEWMLLLLPPGSCVVGVASAWCCRLCACERHHRLFRLSFPRLDDDIRRDCCPPCAILRSWSPRQINDLRLPLRRNFFPRLLAVQSGYLCPFGLLSRYKRTSVGLLGSSSHCTIHHIFYPVLLIYERPRFLYDPTSSSAGGEASHIHQERR